MRKALVKVLTERMESDDSIYVLTADTGFHVFDDFQKQFPDRFLNVGISEAAMMGMASGLALSGKRVFTYGIVPFVTMRCFEQVRNDLCYPCLPVTIVGVGGGLTYGTAGMSHHSIEDIAVMRTLPNMTIICPGDPVETERAVDALCDLPGPCYLRLGKTGEPVVHADGAAGFEIGKGIRLREGKDVALIATGNMLPTAAAACDILAQSGLTPELISMHTVKPIDRELIVDLASRCRKIATIEEHSIIGGLGAAAASVVVDEDLDVRLRQFALPDAYEHVAGSQDYLRRKHGLTAEHIAKTLTEDT